MYCVRNRKKIHHRISQEKGSLAHAENEVERKRLRLEPMNTSSLRSGAGSDPKSGLANRIFAQIPRSQTEHNRRRSRARKQRLNDKIGKGVFETGLESEHPGTHINPVQAIHSLIKRKARAQFSFLPYINKSEYPYYLDLLC